MKRIYTLLNSVFICSILLGTFSLAQAGSYQIQFKERDPGGLPVNRCKLDTATPSPFNSTATYEGIVSCGKCVGLNPAEPWSRYRECQSDFLTKQDKEQCGTEPGTDASKKYLDCQLCHLFVMADDILDTIMWRVVPALAILFFLVAGFYYMASGDDPMKRKRANDIMKSTVIGILLIYGAWIIVNTIFSFTPLINVDFFKTKIWDATSWFTINCPISY